MEVRVSLASEGPYDIPYHTKFEFKSQAKPPPINQPQVFDRLYQESDIRRRNKVVNSLISPKNSRPRSYQDPQRDNKEDIAQSLLRKHAESQAKLALLRAERDYEEAAKLQPAPRINPTSKEILEKAKKLSANLPQPIQAKQPSTARSSKERPETERSRREEPTEQAAEYRLRIPHPKIPQTTHSTVQQMLEQRRKIRKQPSQDNDLPRSDSIQMLREAAQARTQTLEHQEPPDPLEMDVVDRNEYWMQQKKAKILAAREKKKEQEVEGCTFRPNLRTGRQVNSLSSQLSERRLTSTSVSSTRSRSNSRNRSYAELHSKGNTSYSRLANPMVSPPSSRRVREELHSPRSQATLTLSGRSSTLNSPRGFTPVQARTFARTESAAKLPVRSDSKPRSSLKQLPRAPSPRYNQLSPAKRIYSFSSGFNVRDFIQRAQPVSQEPTYKR